MKILNTISIGTKEKIILMEVNHRTLLLGSTPTHITTLYVFDEIEENEYCRDESQPDRETFVEQLKTTLK